MVSPQQSEDMWLHQSSQLIYNVMTCHSLCNQLYLILLDPCVLGLWKVQSLGKLSCSLCISILSFCICFHITQSPSFLLVDKKYQSQNEGRHSCWNHSKNKAYIFLWCKGLTFLDLFSQDAAFCSSVRWCGVTLQYMFPISPFCTYPCGWSELTGMVMSSALNCICEILLMSFC